MTEKIFFCWTYKHCNTRNINSRKLKRINDQKSLTSPEDYGDIVLIVKSWDIIDSIFLLFIQICPYYLKIMLLINYVYYSLIFFWLYSLRVHMFSGCVEGRGLTFSCVDIEVDFTGIYLFLCTYLWCNLELLGCIYDYRWDICLFRIFLDYVIDS